MVDNIGLNINKPVIMMSNLSFDHPLTYEELYNLQILLSSPSIISQVYFKDDIDIESIEKVKLLFEGFPNIDDSKIEKYIMKDLSLEDKQELLEMNFFNINTWNISYNKFDNRYLMTSLVKYKIMDEWFNKVYYELENNRFNLLDKICYIYDKAKMFEHISDSKYERLPEIICDGKANNYGYNLIFKEFLSKLGIKAIISKISGDEDNYVTIASIKDTEYKVDGIYVFDPSMDTIYKDQYKNNLARRMNYNFFGITMEKLKRVYSKRNMQGLLKVLASDDNMEFNHFSDLVSKKEINYIEKEFNMNLNDIFNKINNSKDISNDVMINVMTKTIERYPDDIINKKLLTKTMSDNYTMRNNELFTSKPVKKRNIVDTYK